MPFGIPVLCGPEGRAGLEWRRMSIPASIQFQDVSDVIWDAVVIGAGPAGAAAAIGLARRNKRVLLVDKVAFPRWKVCGCCLSAWGLAALRELGLEELPASVGAAKVREMHLGVRGSKAVLPMGAGVALSRIALDSGLIQRAIGLGASFLPSTTAALGASNDTGSAASVLLRQGTREAMVRSEFLIIADGLGGRLLDSSPEFENIAMNESHIGVGAASHDASGDYPAGLLAMAVGEAGYVGLLRLEDGTLDVAAALSVPRCKLAGGPGEAIGGLLDEVGFPRPSDFGALDWRGTPRLTHRLARVAVGRLFVIGDAACYVEPFTGEGMSWALWSGISMAGIAGSPWSAESPNQWEGQYAGLLRHRQRLCRGISMVLRRPRMRAALVRSLSAMPWLARPIVRAIGHGS